MKKNVKTGLIAVFLVALSSLGYWYYQTEQEFRAYKKMFNTLWVALEKKSRENKQRGPMQSAEDARSWNLETETYITNSINSYRSDNREHIQKGILLLDGLIEDTFDINDEMLSTAEIFLSQRMKNPHTYGDKNEFEWRIKTIEDAKTNADGFKEKLRTNLDLQRQKIADSGLPDRYRIFSWQVWKTDVAPSVNSADEFIYLMETMSRDLKSMYAFLYDYRSRYTPNNEGKLIFNDRYYMDRYNEIVQQLGTGRGFDYYKSFFRNRK